MKIIRQVFSFLLIFCLLVGCVPAVFAAGEKTPITDIAPVDTMLPDESPPTEEVPPIDVSDPVEDPPEEIAPSEDETEPDAEDPEPADDGISDPSEDLPAEDAAPDDDSGNEDDIAPIADETYSIVKGTGIQFAGTLSFYYWRYIGVDTPVMVSCNLQADSIKTVNGRVVYCLDPQLSSDGGNYSADEQNDAWNKLPLALREAIGLTLAYGYPNMNYPASGSNYSTSQEYIDAQNYIATQLIIWEFLAGIRSPYPPFALTGSSSLRNACDAGWGTVRATYDAISAKLQNHKAIPKYAGRTGNIPTYALEYDPATGTYRYLLPEEKQDTWHHYRFTLPEGVSFLKVEDGQTVIGFEATIEAAASLAEPVTLQAVNEGGFQDISDAGQMVWESDGKQPVCISPQADPIQAFLTLQLGSNGTATVQKTTPSGYSPEGYCFKLYHWDNNRVWYGKSDTDGNLFITDSSYSQTGTKVYTFTGLEDGDYTFLEQLSVYGAGNVYPTSWSITVTDVTGAVTFEQTFTQNDFTKDDNGDCRLIVSGLVGLTGGGSLSMTIHNAPLTKSVQIAKVNEDGRTMSGVQLQVLDGDTVVEEWTTTRFSYTVKNLVIGKTYTLHEVATLDGYVLAPDVTFTVEDTAQIQKIIMVNEPTRTQIVKVDESGEPLAGATLQILDGDTVLYEWVTDGSPYEVKKLVVGKEYILREVAAPDGYLLAEDVIFTVENTTEVQTITMVNLPIGSITVHKEDLYGTALGSATFRLDYSIDGGITWQPVSRSDADSLGAVGTCSSPDLQNGCLTTGAEGSITFEGLAVVDVVYRLVEINAPDGYQLLAEPIYIGAIEKNEEQVFAVELCVINTPVLQMPMTGSDGVFQNALTSTLISAALLVALLLTLKKRKATNK